MRTRKSDKIHFPLEVKCSGNPVSGIFKRSLGSFDLFFWLDMQLGYHLSAAILSDGERGQHQFRLLWIHFTAHCSPI